MTAVYLSSAATARLQRAQSVLDEHAVNRAGICLACGVPDCTERDAAAGVFARYQRLPRRRPGNSQRESPGRRSPW